MTVRRGCNGGAFGGALPGSSIRSRILGGTKRPGVAGRAATGIGSLAGVSASAGAGALAAGASTIGSSTGSGIAFGGVEISGGASGSDGASSTSALSVAATGGGAGGAGGRIVLIRRGGGRTGADGLASAGADVFFALPLVFFAAFTAASEKMSPFGRSIPRWRARRSTNWRATISSSVLEALFNSMP